MYPIASISAVVRSRLMLPRGLKYSIYIAIQEISMSRLMLPRGLKCRWWTLSTWWLGRGLCCLVDWNATIAGQSMRHCVEAYVASWIEIRYRWFERREKDVEAYVASWIEISAGFRCRILSSSRLMLPRGLKYIPPTSSVAILRRGLCCLVDWNCWITGPCLASIPSRLMLPRGLKSAGPVGPCGPVLSRLMLPRGLK